MADKTSGLRVSSATSGYRFLPVFDNNFEAVSVTRTAAFSAADCYTRAGALHSESRCTASTASAGSAAAVRFIRTPHESTSPRCSAASRGPLRPTRCFDGGPCRLYRLPCRGSPATAAGFAAAGLLAAWSGSSPALKKLHRGFRLRLLGRDRRRGPDDERALVQSETDLGDHVGQPAFLFARDHLDENAGTRLDSSDDLVSV